MVLLAQGDLAHQMWALDLCLLSPVSIILHSEWDRQSATSFALLGCHTDMLRNLGGRRLLYRVFTC